MPDDNENETVDERVARLVAEELDNRDKRAAKDDKLKKMGLTQDVLDTIADAVWDRGEARRAQRDKERDEEDQEPTKGGKPKRAGFLQQIGLAANDE